MPYDPNSMVYDLAMQNLQGPAPAADAYIPPSGSSNVSMSSLPGPPEEPDIWSQLDNGRVPTNTVASSGFNAENYWQNQFDQSEYDRILANRDAIAQNPGSPDYMKLTMWANHDDWLARQQGDASAGGGSTVAAPKAVEPVRGRRGRNQAPMMPPEPTTPPAMDSQMTGMGMPPLPGEAPPGQALNAAASMPPPVPQSNPMSSGGSSMTPQNQQHSIDININKPDENMMNAMPPAPMNHTAVAQAYPQPNPQVLPPASPYSPFQGPTPVPPAMPPPPPRSGNVGGGGFRDPGPAVPGGNGQFGAPTFGEDNYYGPQQIAGTRPDNADYNSVQGFSDAAYQNARRYLDPQQAMQDRRFDQELINKGIDPQSPQGIEAAKLLGMQQADANNSAAFGAMGFGQGIQDQMAQQAFQRSGLAGDMQKSLWDAQLGSSGQELQKYLGDQSAATANAQMQNQYNLGMAGLDLQQLLGQQGMDQQAQLAQNQYNLGLGGLDLERYGMDLGNQLSQGQLDMARQGQDFNQMLGLEGLNFRDTQFDNQNQQYQDQLMLALLGMNQPGQAGMIDPTGMAATQMGNSAGAQGILGTLFG